MVIPLTARNVVRVTATIRAILVSVKVSYVLEAFAGVKISKKKGLPGRHKDSQVSNLARLPYLQ